MLNGAERTARKRRRRGVRVEREVRLHVWLACNATRPADHCCDALDTFESEQHIEIARAFLTKGDQRLVFG